MDCWVRSSLAQVMALMAQPLGVGMLGPGQGGCWAPYQWAWAHPPGAPKPCCLKKNWWGWQHMWATLQVGFFIFYFFLLLLNTEPDVIIFSRYSGKPAETAFQNKNFDSHYSSRLHQLRTSSLFNPRCDERTFSKSGCWQPEEVFRNGR